jgi:hypothetical protein
MLLHCNADERLGEAEYHGECQKTSGSDRQPHLLRERLYFSTYVIYPEVDMLGVENTEYRS